MPMPDTAASDRLASARDVAEIIGAAEERLVLDILATRASAAEISEAYHRLTAVGGDLGKPMTARVAADFELIRVDLDRPEEEA
jgi:hypothetical protein